MKYLIATHAGFSHGLVDSLQLIIGKEKQIDTFSMSQEKSAEEAEAEVRAYLTKTLSETLVVFTDVFGGSVSNLFTDFLLQGYVFQLITGVNLPLILTVLLAEDGDLEQVILTGIEAGKQGILHVNQLIKEQEVNLNDDIIIED